MLDNRLTRHSMMQSSRDVVAGNIDLLTEILLRLPVKDVGRCKCVSKQWLALISNPQFCHSHSCRLSNTSASCFLWHRSYRQFHRIPLTNFDSNSSTIRTYQFHDNDESYPQIIHSCNGFLLFKHVYYNGKRDDRPYNSYEVVNPTTKHSRILNFPDQNFHYEISALYLAFDPLRSIHFKVISFLRVKSESRRIKKGETSGPKKFEINTYSSETSSWNGDGVFFTASPNFIVDSGVYFNGAIHWYNSGEGSIYFDVHRQCFKTLPEPEFDNSRNVHVKYFGESRGNLLLILTKSDESLDFDILELKEDYSGWVVRYHVDLNLIGDAFSRHVDSPFYVLCVVHQASEEDSMVVLFQDFKIMSYNLKDHTSRIIYESEDFRDIEAYAIGKYFCPCFETLLNVGLERTYEWNNLES